MVNSDGQVCNGLPEAVCDKLPPKPASIGAGGESEGGQEVPQDEYACKNCPFPYYGRGCELVMENDPCDASAADRVSEFKCFNNGECVRAKVAAFGGVEIDEYGMWNAATCICEYSEGVCFADPQCSTKVECFDLPDTVSCSHRAKYGNSGPGPKGVCSSNPICFPTITNKFCMPGGATKMFSSPLPSLAPGLDEEELRMSAAAASDDGGGGTIAGIIVGIVLLLLLIVGIVLWRKRNQSNVMGALKTHRRNTLAAMNNPTYDAANGGGGGRVGRGRGRGNSHTSPGGAAASADPSYLEPNRLAAGYLEPKPLAAAYSEARTGAAYSDASGFGGSAAAVAPRGGALANATYDSVESDGPATGGTRAGGAVLNLTYDDASNPINGVPAGVGANALYDQAAGAGADALYDQAAGGGGGGGGAALYDQAGASGAVYDSAGAIGSHAGFSGAAAPVLYDEAGRGDTALYDEAGGSGDPFALHSFNVGRLDAWLTFANRPAAETGFTRATANTLLHASPIGQGAFCFRPSSQGGATVVLCVLVEGKVANLRIDTASNGAVKVKDLASEPISFKSMDHALAHFADPDAKPNNSAPLVESAALPAGATDGSAPARPPKGGISRDGRQQSAYLGFSNDDDVDL